MSNQLVVKSLARFSGNSAKLEQNWLAALLRLRLRAGKALVPRTSILLCHRHERDAQHEAQGQCARDSHLLTIPIRTKVL